MAAIAWLSIVKVDAPVWVSMLVRASFKRWAVTWISLSWAGGADALDEADASVVAAEASAAAADESVVSATAAQVRTSSATPQAAVAIESLDMKISPQKLNE